MFAAINYSSKLGIKWYLENNDENKNDGFVKITTFLRYVDFFARKNTI